MVIDMITVLNVSHFDWRAPDGRLVPRTRVTWRDAKGVVRTDIFEGTLRTLSDIERKVRMIR